MLEKKRISFFEDKILMSIHVEFLEKLTSKIPFPAVTTFAVPLTLFSNPNVSCLFSTTIV
jgi:hypothetical protein